MRPSTDAAVEPDILVPYVDWAPGGWGWVVHDLDTTPVPPPHVHVNKAYVLCSTEWPRDLDAVPWATRGLDGLDYVMTVWPWVAYD